MGYRWRWTPEMIAEITRRVRAGETQAAVARDYGVSDSIICRIVSGAYRRVERPSPTERFWKKVDRRGAVPVGRPELGPCWIWLAAGNGADYGKIFVDGKLMLAHVFSWREEHGPVPDGLELDHLCRVTRCVNPRHLEPVTPRENALRGESVFARNARKTHCHAGHPFDEKNTYVTRRGFRQCRACARLRAQ